MTLLQKAHVSSSFAAIKQVDENLKLVIKIAMPVLWSIMVKECLKKMQPFKLVQKSVWDVAQNVICKKALCTRHCNMLRLIFLARATEFSNLTGNRAQSREGSFLKLKEAILTRVLPACRELKMPCWRYRPKHASYQGRCERKLAWLNTLSESWSSIQMRKIVRI